MDFLVCVLKTFEQSSNVTWSAPIADKPFGQSVGRVTEVSDYDSGFQGSSLCHRIHNNYHSDKVYVGSARLHVASIID